MRTLSSIFGSAVAIRNGLYDRGVLKIRRLSRPVVSIGNISVGGSGKTPFVIALGEILKQRGIAFDVLSRGYGRRSSVISTVDQNGTPEQFGDEPLLIARKLGVPVIVGADRYQAGLFAERNFPSALHLLDDGFQHRHLHRDFDIVMLPSSDLHDALLPLGRLREPRASLQRADAVVMTAPVAEPDLELARRCMKLPHNVWTVRRVLEIDQNVTGKLVAFCGLARPEQFFAQLRELNLNLTATLSFSDHHQYSETDLDRLLKARADAGAASFITTEKDLINLGAFTAKLQPLQAARLRMELDAQEVASTILKTLEQRCGCRL
jgi:tetraacyldisaccharide 4'-kinase